MSETTLPIIEKLYAVYKQLVVCNTKLEKAHRYSLGESTEKSVLEILELLFFAQNAPKTHKTAYLIRAQALIDVLRIKLRLYLELKLVNETKVFQMQANLEETGRMLGGWTKSLL
jgi:hypothetical protein